MVLFMVLYDLSNVKRRFNGIWLLADNRVGMIPRLVHAGRK